MSGVEGIEAADLMSLLEQFEVTEVRKEPSVLITGTEPAAGRRFADQVFGAELASTAGLTPPATPPHQYWISPSPAVTAGDAHPGGSAEIAPASPPPLGWLLQPAKCVGPPTPPSDPRSSPTSPYDTRTKPTLPSDPRSSPTDPRTKPILPSDPGTKPILTSDSRNKPNLPSDARIMPSYPKPSPTLPCDPIASLTLPSDPRTSPIPSPDPRTSSSMPYDPRTPPSDLRFPPSDPRLVPTPAPCVDHEYCLPASVRKTLPPSSLPPTSLPPSALSDLGCRWNVRRQHGITIKPITLLSRRATEASDRAMTAEAPSSRGPASGPAARVDTTPCSRLDASPFPPGSAQHGQKTSLESPRHSPQTHVSPCYSRDCSTSSSSGSSSRSRSRSPAQKRRRYCRRRSRHSRHSSRSDSRSSSRSRSYSRSSSWSTSASRSRSRSPQSCSVRMSYFEQLEPFEEPRHRYRTSRHQAVEHKISRSRELAIEERRVVYVGKIRNGMKREELRRRFEVFGEIEDCNIYFRTQGDNYGFVTFRYTCDAFAAIENGQTVRRPDEMPFDLCFGGRRQFCKTNYADLDSNHSEVGPYSSKSKFESLDFDTLLKQAKRSARR